MDKKLPENVKIPDLDALFIKSLEAKFEDNYDLKPGRQRPRNPQERETLLRWERERGGKKIGTI